jgi:GGDEF domain-containing protein
MPTTVSSLKIAQIGTGTPHFLEGQTQNHPTAAELLTHSPCHIIILDLPEREEAQALKALRADPRYSHALIYGIRGNNGLCKVLGDGPLPPTEDQFLLEFRTWNERFQTIKDELASASLEFQALAWLWTGPERKLYSHPAPSTPSVYSYPILEQLATKIDEHDFFWTLQFMTQQGWLDPETLIDRIRRCTKCGSGHLNYIDLCPECNSLDIQRRPSLHCFVCGHVGSQETFLKDGGMFCPNCMSRLRHIGSDYDRPMENYSCNHCDAFFVDAKVQARCLDCGTSNEPDALKVQQIHTYKLTEAGRLRCRHGGADALDLDAHFDFHGLVGMDTFIYTLDWLLEIVQRYKKPSFSLVGLRLVNLRQTLQKMGERQGYALLDSIVARLIEIIRKTDRCARPSEDILWVLLPETSKEGAEKFLRRLGSLAELFTQAGARIESRTVICSAPDDLLTAETGQVLLGRLTGELE